MKKIKYYALAAMSMLFAGCSQDEALDMPNNGGEGETISITVGMPGNEKNSRVSYDDETKTLNWEESDRLLIVGSDGSKLVGSTEFLVNGTIDNQARTATFTGKLPAGATQFKIFYKTPKLALDLSKDIAQAATFDYTGQNSNNLKDYLYLCYPSMKSAEKQFITKEELVAGNIKMAMNNSIVVFNIESMPKDMENIQKIRLETNTEDKEAAPSTDANVSIYPNGQFPVKVYMSIDPDQMKLQADKTLTVYLSSDTKDYKLSSPKSTAGKDYLPGTRYQINISMDAKEGYLSNWQENVVELNIPTNEIWVKASVTIALQSEKAELKNWHVGEVQGTPYQKIYLTQDDGVTPEPIIDIPNTTLMDRSSIEGLQEIYFPEGLVTIGDLSISGGQNYARPSYLTKIHLSSTITKIGVDAFEHCTSLRSINLHKNMTLGEGAFYSHKLTNIVLPEGTIDQGAFIGKTNDVVEEYVLSDRCAIDAKPTVNGAYYDGIRFKYIIVKPGATVDFSARSFFNDYYYTYRLETFKFLGTIASSIHPDFMMDYGDPVTYKTNLILNVDWLNPGDDSNAEYKTAGATADLRTPKQVTDPQTNAVTYQWMGVNWKSITFVNPDGSEMTPEQVKANTALNGSAVWGDPDAVVK